MMFGKNLLKKILLCVMWFSFSVGLWMLLKRLLWSESLITDIVELAYSFAMGLAYFGVERIFFKEEI